MPEEALFAREMMHFLGAAHTPRPLRRSLTALWTVLSIPCDLAARSPSIAEQARCWPRLSPDDAMTSRRRRVSVRELGGRRGHATPGQRVPRGVVFGPNP